MGKFRRADEEVVDLVTEVREKWHRGLEFARIGVLMRNEAPVTKGRVTLGKAKKTTDEERLLSREELDFIVWFAADQWETLTDEQKTALVDHELCHCRFLNGSAEIRPHDVEEFDAVIRRHGLWWPDAERTIEAIQPHFGFLNGGGVEAIDPDPFNEKDVLDQVDQVVSAQGETAE